MKYAKSDKGYYIPKGGEKEANPGMSGNESAGANKNGSSGGDPGGTSLTWEEAGYRQTKDQYGGQVFVPKKFERVNMIDPMTKEGDMFYMKAYGYQKANNGEFYPIVWDMQKNAIDKELTKEMSNRGTRDFPNLGVSTLNQEAVGRILHKRGIDVMGAMIDPLIKAGVQEGTIPIVEPGKQWKWDIQNKQ